MIHSNTAACLSRRSSWLLIALCMAGCQFMPSLPQQEAPPPAPAFEPPIARPAAPRILVTESPAVAARFTDPIVPHRTPAFAPNHPSFTSNIELRDFLHSMARNRTENAPKITLLQLGNTKSGLALEALLFTHEASGTDTAARTSRPTVLLVGQQHGDEPAGSEALLVIAQELAHGSLRPLLEQINVLVLPRANPDGTAKGQRHGAEGIDIDADQLLLRTPEAKALAQLAREYEPMVVIDAQEYAVGGAFLEQFNAMPAFDALVQYATTPQLPSFVTKASEEWFRQPMLQALQGAGLSSEWYHTASSADKRVSMGTLAPDNVRNAFGLRNAISLVVASRGTGLGREHLMRRVNTHVVAISSVLNSTAGRAADLQKLRRFVENEATTKACRGDVVIEAAPTASEYSLQMLDPDTAEPKAVKVNWQSSLKTTSKRSRSRPCGYWLGADQTESVARLRSLGVRVNKLAEIATLRVEAFAETSRRTGDKGTLDVKVTTRPAVAVEVDADGYYVPLDQPLAHLAIATLEPDTPYSFITHRVMSGVSRVWGAPRRPTTRLVAVP